MTWNLWFFCLYLPSAQITDLCHQPWPQMEHSAKTSGAYSWCHQYQRVPLAKLYEILTVPRLPMAATSLMSDGVREWTVKIKTQVEGQTGPQSRQRMLYVDAQSRPTPQSSNTASKAKPAAKFRILYLLGTPRTHTQGSLPSGGHTMNLDLSSPSPCPMVFMASSYLTFCLPLTSN